MINLNHLRIFCHVAEHLSFTKAAKDLFISQPAVTNQLGSFERHWGIKLFRKTGRNIYLTEEGKILYERAQRLFECEKEIEEVLRDIKAMKCGILRVGTIKTFARYTMPLLITCFHKSYPQVKVIVDEGGSENMLSNLLSYKNEVAIIAGSEYNPELCVIPFCREDLVAIVPIHHPLARKSAICFEEIADEPIIIREIHSQTRELVNDLFVRKGRIPHIITETSNLELLKDLVRRGEGVSLISREAASAEPHDKKLAILELKDPELFLNISIYYLRNHDLSPPAQRFIEMLRQLLEDGEKPRTILDIREKLLTMKNDAQ